MITLVVFQECTVIGERVSHRLVSPEVGNDDDVLALDMFACLGIDMACGDGAVHDLATYDLGFHTEVVVRFTDVKRNTLVYLVYSDKLIEGSPKNVVSSVPVQPWR